MRKADKILERRIKWRAKNCTDKNEKRYYRDRETGLAYYRWVKKVQKHLPELARRVFDLRGKHYMGCGFHYGLEKLLGNVISALNDYSSHRQGQEEFTFKILTEINVRALFIDIKEAEQSIIAEN